VLYLLYEWLKDSPEWAKWLNFLKYPTFRIVAAAFGSLVLGMVVGPRLIDRLRIEQHGQSNVREDTPDRHQQKKGTPTLGGALILLSIFFGTFTFADLKSRPVWVVLLMTAGYGLIGFADDWLKLSKRNSKGLPGRYKMIGQTALYLVAVFGIMTDWSGATPHLLIETKITIPFIPTHWANPDLGWFYVFFGWIVVVGTSNAVNITDGLDGLAIAPTMVAAGTFAILCYLGGTGLAVADVVHGKLVGVPLHEYLGIAAVPGGSELAVFCAAVVGAGISFLWFNAYPASVFMGDVGSLALGGALGTLAMLSKNEITSAIIHLVFLVEILSVMLQVSSFKLRGKRIFKMAPIHHHFELAGVAEPKIIVRFWIVSILCAALALMSLKLR
jgi:phospho-N-acetylmuramoyl-pentapeptide-transferase